MIIRTHAAQATLPKEPIVQEEKKASVEQLSPRPKREYKRKKVEGIVPDFSGLIQEEQENEE